MAKFYQPQINDPKMEIRKAIQKIRKESKMDKSKIIELLIRCGLKNSEKIFSEKNEE
jgi:hypothetical protein